MSSNFKNIIVYQSNGTSEESNVNDLLANEQNKFEGWVCWAGIQNITIRSNGEVVRAVCGVGGSLGNIYTGFSIPTEPIICTKNKCTCAADIQLSKALPEHIYKLRVKI